MVAAQFRDALAMLIQEGYDSTDVEAEKTIAALILFDSPEMLKIRSALLKAADLQSFADKQFNRKGSLAKLGLPDQVIEWVLA